MNRQGARVKLKKGMGMILKREMELEDYKGIKVKNKNGRTIMCWQNLNSIFVRAKKKK